MFYISLLNQRDLVVLRTELGRVHATAWLANSSRQLTLTSLNLS